jgi:hypothetical protein
MSGWNSFRNKGVKQSNVNVGQIAKVQEHEDLGVYSMRVLSTYLLSLRTEGISEDISS